MSTNRGGTLRRYSYYVCQRKIRDHNDACTNKSHRAEKVEAHVWRFVSDLLKDPDRLRAGLDRMIEQERDGSRGEPEWEAKTWLEKLAETDRRRDGYLELAADGLMNRDELRTKLAALEDTRKTAERELKLIRDRKERMEVLERDKELLLASYADALPEALDELAPEERRQIYAMLRLRVNVGSDGILDVSGVFGGDTCVCKSEPTSTCSAYSTPPAPPYARCCAKAQEQTSSSSPASRVAASSAPTERSTRRRSTPSPPSPRACVWTCTGRVSG
jgi:hypothetical protein